MTTTRPATIELETRSREVVDVAERIGGLLGGAPDGSGHVFLQRPGAGRPEGPRRREIELRLRAAA